MKLLLAPVLLAAALAASSCRKERHAQTDPQGEISESLAAKKKLYCDLSREPVKARGYSVGRCDGLLFTSLRAIACRDDDISRFQTDEGKWYRNPEKDCFIVDPVTGEKRNNGADSTISKDMMIGAMSHMWWAKDKQKVDATISYGTDHHWVMGEGENATAVLSKCVLSPGLISTLYDIKGALDKTAPLVDEEVEDEEHNQFPVNTGFRAHLDVLHALVNGSVNGSISGSEYEMLKRQAERQPRNALYQAAFARFSGGNMDAATAVLLDTQLFPADRLPTSAEYCTDYLFQRDTDLTDWAPCPEKGEVHDGTDLVFAVSIIDGSYFTQ